MSYSLSLLFSLPILMVLLGQDFMTSRNRGFISQQFSILAPGVFQIVVHYIVNRVPFGTHPDPADPVQGQIYHSFLDESSVTPPFPTQHIASQIHKLNNPVPEWSNYRNWGNSHHVPVCSALLREDNSVSFTQQCYLGPRLWHIEGRKCFVGGTTQLRGPLAAKYNQWADLNAQMPM